MMNSISCVSYTQEIRTFYASKRKLGTVLDEAFILKSSFASFVFFLTYKFHVTRLAVIEKENAFTYQTHGVQIVLT